MTHPRRGSFLIVWGVLTLSACGLDSSGGAGSGGAGGGIGGVGGALTMCRVNSECVVAPESCCGSCGAATRGDAIAIRRDAVGEHQTHACGTDFGCPACFMEPDPTLMATCETERCELIDLQASDLTRCVDHDECKLRLSGCCECGDILQGQVIAIRQDAEMTYQVLTCDGDTACDACLPNLEGAFTALCLEGVCRALPNRDF